MDGSNNLDTADDGKVPRGMEVRHEDDDEGGEQSVDNADQDGGQDDEAERVRASAVDIARASPPAVTIPAVIKDDEEEEDAEATATTSAAAFRSSKVKASDQAEGDEDDDDDEEEDDDDEEEEDEDEDEDEEDEEGEGRSQRPRKKKRRFRANKYVDIEVEVDEDEEDEDEEGEAGFEAAENYLERPDGTRRLIPIADSFADEDEEGDTNDDRDHRQLERRVRDKEEQEALRIAREYKERHRHRRQGMGIQAMQDFAPRSVLMPSVNDPSIWCVKCKIGREKELVMSISRKASVLNLSISSAFQRDSFHGHLYVEARSEAHVREATAGLIGIYGATAPILVPIEEMPDLLKSRKKETPLAIGGWVRVRRGAYKGDLAQVDDVPEGTEMVTLKLVPRIDLQPREDREDANGGGVNGINGQKKRRRAAAESSLFRPPPKFFNAEEVKAAYAGKAKVVKDSEGYHFQNDIYADGYLIKDFRLSNIERENINPTIDEITRFMGETAVASSAAAGADGSGVAGATGDNRLDLNLIADAAKQQTILQPGDSVEIFEGSQKGVVGVIESIQGNVLSVSPTEPADLVGTSIEVLASQVRKRFKAGDHVKVLRGKNVNESGLVLKVKDDLVTFLSDLSVQEVTVFSKDVREAAEVGSGASSYGQYELHDLVQLDPETSGVIFKIEPDTFRILDQMGTVRLLRPSQVIAKIDTRRMVALDHEGYELRIGDLVKEITRGPHEPRQGRVLHIYRSQYAFLHNRDVVENGGVFVTAARNLGSLAPRSTQTGDLTKMNPALGNGLNSAAAASGMLGGAGGDAARPRREYALGLHVVVVKGNHKGYKGIIKDLNGPLARVELHTRSQTITIERTKLGTQDPNGSGIIPLQEWEKAKMTRTPMGAGQTGSNLTPLSGSMGGRSRGGNGQFSSSYGASPAGRSSSGSIYSTGKTPMYNPAGSATPYGGGFGGGATPFGAGSATPFGAGGATPYASGRTPAYGGNAFSASSRTPYAASGANAFSASSRTPYSGSAGNAGGGGGWGGSTPYGGGASAGQSSSTSSSSSSSLAAAAWGSASPAYQQPATSSYLGAASTGGSGGGGAAAWGSASPAYNDSYSSSASRGASNNNNNDRVAAANNAWGSIEPSVSAPTPAAAGAWGSTSPAYNQNNNSSSSSSSSYNNRYNSNNNNSLSAPSPWASVDTAQTPYPTAPTPSAPTPAPYDSAPTPADPSGGGGGGDWGSYDSAPTPAVSAPTPYAAVATPGPWDDD